MPSVKAVAVLVGSLRKDSYNRKIAREVVALFPATLHAVFVEIGDLPLYDPDVDTDSPPAAWTRFRDEVRAADALLFATPEYNRSVPGALKNAIDVGSRPYGKSVFAGKPGAVISASPGGGGGFGANHHLRQSLVFLDVPAMQQPEAYIGNVASLFDAEGRLSNDQTRGFLQKFANAFAAWVAVHAKT